MRVRRTGCAAVLALCVVLLGAAPSGAVVDLQGSFGPGAPFQHSESSDLGLNVINATPCGDDNPGATRCDSYVLTATGSGPATFTIDVPDAWFVGPELEGLLGLTVGPDFDLHVFEGAVYDPDAEIDVPNQRSGYDESVATEATGGEVFRVEVVHFTSFGDGYTLTARLG